MKTAKFSCCGFEVAVSISSDIVCEYRGDMPDLLANCELWIQKLSPEQLEYIKLFGLKTNRRGIAMLHAHGDHIDGKWCYHDRGQDWNVQTWVNNKDGCACIFLATCNPGHATISVEKSLLALPDRIAGLPTGYSVVYSLIGPYGEISNYTIDARISDLRKELMQ